MRLSGLLLAFGLVLSSFSLPVFAQDGGFYAQVLVIDRDRLIRESNVGQKLRDAVIAETQRIGEWNKSQLEALRAESQKVAEQRANLSSEELQQKNAELNGKANNIRAQVAKARQDVETYGRVQRAAILKQLNDIATAIAVDKGANMVVERAAVIIMAPDFDVTDDAIARLNDVMPELVDLSGDGANKE